MTQTKQYPPAPRSETKEYYQSAQDGTVEVANPYDSLQDLNRTDTKAFIEAQNAAFLGFLPDSDPAILASKQKLGGILMKTYADAFVTSAPKFVGEDVFLRILGRGKPFGVTYRWSKKDFLARKVLSEGVSPPDPLVFHDESISGKALISSSFSQGGKWWAYNEAVSGSDWGVIRVKAVDGGSVLPDEIHDSKFNTKPGPSITWLGDRGFFYQYWLAAQDSKDGKRRPQLKFHVLGTAQADDEVVFEDHEHLERTFRMTLNETGTIAVLDVFGVTATSKVMMANIGSSTISPLNLEFRTVCDDFSSEWEYLGEHLQSGRHLLWTNADNGKIVASDVELPSDFKVIVSPTAKKPLRDARMLPNGDILVVRSIDVQDQLQLFSVDGDQKGDINTPAKTVVDMSYDTASQTLIVMESSFSSPPQLWSVSTAESNGKEEPMPLTLLGASQTGIPGSSISSKRHFYTSADGTRIPIFITAEDSLQINEGTPVLLYIYGGFGISLIPHFRPEFVSFIRGFRGILATANIRGGSEYGRAWYEAACKENRQSLFDDIIGAARFIKSDITKHSSSPVILMGESMGALNSSAVMVQQPDLLSAVILNAGAFDILHRSKMGLTGRGAEDIGDSHDPAQFDFIRPWEPLHNIEVGRRYPPVLLTAGNQDDLVSMAHSLKMAATLQHATQGVERAGIVSLKIIDNLGHGGNISAIQRAAVTMSRWLWVMKVLGLQMY